MRLAVLIALGLLAPSIAWSALAQPQMTQPAAVSPEAEEFFEKNVRPVLAEKCYSCHGAKTQFAELRVDSRVALLKGSDKGPALVPGKPEQSSLIKVLSHAGPIKMPPNARLSDAEIANLTTWVKMGAPWPNDAAAPEKSIEERIEEARSRHWSLQPVRKPAIPAVKNRTWPKNELDRFILARLEAKGLAPSPTADRRTLIRRVYYDLLGLPPTPQEVAQFIADRSPDAYEKLIDRLLASPHYGERWGRMWLDVARYSDTLGYLVQPSERRYPYAYTYRDYVIRSFNEDKPYDRFILEQIAADQIELQDRRNLAALGFLTIGNRYLNNQLEIIDDRIDVVTRGLQGLTVQCARCHDHKYDPIPAADYYSLYGIFASTTEPAELPQIGDPADPQAFAEFTRQYEALKKREAELRAAKNDGEAGNVARQIQALLIEHPGVPPRAMVLEDRPQPVSQRIFLRGNPGTPGDAVPRQYLLAALGERRKPFEKGSGRLELAQTIANRENPLTARVLVNRVWLGHFGKGLVSTPSDFGIRGEEPSHPELLDWLATTFMDEGWSIKKLHRRILLSATYQQTSVGNPAGNKVDPENRLLWRMNRLRLDFEQIRDGMLRATGVLNSTVGGRAVDIIGDPNNTRRTLYGFIDRQDLPTLYRIFDFADPNAHSPQRVATTVPQQALYFMNSAFVQQQARNLLRASEVAAQQAPEERIRQLNRLAYGRSPAPEEVRLALDFIRQAEGLPFSPEVAASAWSYGYGPYDPVAKKLTSFTALPHFTGQAWQGGPVLPDPKIGWVTLNARGGHTGNPHHAAVRRWTAPADLVLHISGRVSHNNSNGDGVEALIVSSRDGLLGNWVVHNSASDTAVARVTVKQGDTLDFVLFCRANESYDGFEWAPRLAAMNAEPGRVAAWDAGSDFEGPGVARPEPLSPWEAYAQALLLSNEFLFVD